MQFKSVIDCTNSQCFDWYQLTGGINPRKQSEKCCMSSIADNLVGPGKDTERLRVTEIYLKWWRYECKAETLRTSTYSRNKRCLPAPTPAFATNRLLQLNTVRTCA